MSGRGVRGAHLQEDPGDPPPVVAGLGGGVEVLRVVPLDRDGGVWGLELECVKDLQDGQ